MSSPVDPQLRNRYDGKPLLILLENFVLATIGALPEERFAAVGDLVRRTFDAPPDSDWMEVFRTQLDLPPEVYAGIRDAWQRSLIKLAEVGEPPDPIYFARGLVDRNFAAFINPEPPGGASDAGRPA